MRAQDHYAAIFESSEDGIVAKNLEGIVLSWNPAAERLFGWTADEIIGQSIRRLLPPDRHDEEDLILARIRQGDKIDQFLTERLHKDGHRLHVSVSISPIRTASGEIIGASKIVRDASERVEAEHRLRESEARFRLLAENISQFAWIADPDGRIFWFNRRWSDYTGLSENDPPDHEGARVVHPEHVERVYANYARAIAEGVEYEDTFPLRGKDGTYRWFLARALPIRDEDDSIVCWFGTNTDITEQREQTDQINTLLREVNHRSKNMLAKVQALARSSIEGDPELVKRFEERVGGLAVNQDILVSRDWREVPVDELVRMQLHFIDHFGGRVSRSGPDVALIPRAAEILGMALHELATNSLKYGSLSVPEGTIEIAWECQETHLRITWRESGGPKVMKPSRRGFGSQLIEDIPRRALGGDVKHTFEAPGIVWELTMDNSNLAESARLLP